MSSAFPAGGWPPLRSGSKKLDGKDGYIDLLWKGILLVEHKSRGKDLDRAYQQAKDYFPGIKDRDLPRYILVSDFARFRLYDLEEDTQHEFPLKELYKNIRLFGFIAGYQTTSYKEQDPVNIKAAERMGRLHDKLKAVGYAGHELEVIWSACCSACLPKTPAFSSAASFRTSSNSAPPTTATIWPNGWRTCFRC